MKGKASEQQAGRGAARKQMRCRCGRRPALSSPPSPGAPRCQPPDLERTCVSYRARLPGVLTDPASRTLRAFTRWKRKACKATVNRDAEPCKHFALSCSQRGQAQLARACLWVFIPDLVTNRKPPPCTQRVFLSAPRYHSPTPVLLQALHLFPGEGSEHTNSKLHPIWAALSPRRTAGRASRIS